MTVPASLSKWAHPPRSKTPRWSSCGPPGPCITPSTETCAVVVSFMVAAPSALSLALVGRLTWSQRLCAGSCAGSTCAFAHAVVAEENAARRHDLDDVPVAVRLLALGPRHVVLDAAAGCQIVPGEGGGV